MADSAAFEWLCSALENASSFNRLEARGTVRLALKSAGLEPSSVNAPQLAVVLEKVLPGELAGRGADDSENLCRRLAARLSEVPDSPESGDTPEAVFERLGG